jgi:predicted permease
VIGRTVKLNGIHFTIVGVAPARLKGSFPGVVSDFWIPLQMSDAMEETPSLANRSSRSLFVHGRLRPGVTRVQAQARFATVARRMAAAYPKEDGKVEVTLVPTREVVLNPQIDGPVLGVAAGLMAIVGLVLLIACSNIANLLLVRASERRREIAVRLALGAGRGRLIRQLLTESLLLAGFGGLAGLLLAFWMARLIVSFKPPIALPLSIDVRLDLRVLAFTFALSVLTGLVCGLAPAFRASRPDLVSALKDDSAGGGSRHRRLGLRNLLVIGQVATSTVLLIGAGLFLRSMGNAQSIDPGFRMRRGAAIQLVVGLGGAYDEAEGRVFFQRLLERARALPGVRSATLAEHLPLGLNIHTSTVEAEGRPKPKDEEGFPVDVVSVSDGYFDTLGIGLNRGRVFDERDGRGAAGVAIVNETAARRFWPGEDPIGKRLRFISVGGPGRPWMTVVGVAQDGKYRTLGEEPRSFVYQSSLQDYSSFQTLILAADSGAGDERALLSEARRLLDELDPNVPIFDQKTMTEHLSVMLFPARMAAALLAAFGALGLVLASIGLYGVVAASVARRTREVGIRMAMGARRRDVLRLVLREGMVLTCTGLAVGLGLAFAAARLLRTLLYGIGTGDPLTYAGVAAVLTAVALCANLVPAQRATEVDPLVALRYD